MGAAAALAATIALGFAGSASAEYLGTVEFHARACPADAADPFADCHDNPVADYYFDGYDIESCTTDENGNCTAVNEGNPTAEISYDPDCSFAVYCLSDEEAIVAEVRGTDVSISWAHDVDALVVCDFYEMDDTLPLAHSGSDMPDTGAGPMTQGANLGLLLAGVVALGGLAVASRRAAVR